MRMLLLVLAGAAPGVPLHAAVITYGGEYADIGGGFGTNLSVLALQNNVIESGSVLRVGGVDVLTGDAKPQSATRSVAEMIQFGLNPEQFAVVLSVKEPPPKGEITLHEFTLVFTDAVGNLLFDSTFAETLVLGEIGVAMSGHLFNVNLSPGEFALFFGDPTNRLGLIVPEDNPIFTSDGGPETFFVIPAPAAAGPLALGLLVARRRR